MILSHGALTARFVQACNLTSFCSVPFFFSGGASTEINHVRGSLIWWNGTTLEERYHPQWPVAAKQLVRPSQKVMRFYLEALVHRSHLVRPLLPFFPHPILILRLCTGMVHDEEPDQPRPGRESGSAMRGEGHRPVNAL